MSFAIHGSNLIITIPWAQTTLITVLVILGVLWLFTALRRR